MAAFEHAEGFSPATGVGDPNDQAHGLRLQLPVQSQATNLKPLESDSFMAGFGFRERWASCCWPKWRMTAPLMHCDH